MWITVTRRTPTTTCATCRTEHACTLLSVSRLNHVSHHIGSSRPWVFHLHPHTIHDERFSLSCSTSPFTSTCTSPSFSFPSSPCTPTTLTPWLTTCATPPRGATTATTSPSHSQMLLGSLLSSGKGQGSSSRRTSAPTSHSSHSALEFCGTCSCWTRPLCDRVGHGETLVPDVVQWSDNGSREELAPKPTLKFEDRTLHWTQHTRILFSLHIWSTVVSHFTFHPMH